MRHSTSLVVKKAVMVIVVLTAASAAKVFYRTADAGSLEWLLAPTAFFVEAASGIAFDNEPGLGWVNGEFGVNIAPSCSGMNYLIILFCVSSLAAVPSLGSFRALGCWLVFSAAGAYLFTLPVNCLRIWFSIMLYQADIYSASITVESVHRVAGVVIYYFSMVFYYLAVSFILRLATGNRRRPESGSPVLAAGMVRLLWPFCCYLLFTVAVPYLGGAASEVRFFPHVQAVVGVSGGLTTALILGVVTYRLLMKRLRSLHARRQSG